LKKNSTIVLASLFICLGAQRKRFLFVHHAASANQNSSFTKIQNKGILFNQVQPFPLKIKIFYEKGARG
jgi:hypothetical protein